MWKALPYTTTIIYIYIVYTYLVPKVKYAYFSRSNVPICPRSRRLRGHITTFLRGKYAYLPEEQDMYSIHMIFNGFIYPVGMYLPSRK